MAPRRRRPTATFTDSLRWPDARRGPYRVRCMWALMDDGQVQLVSFQVAGFQGDDGPDLGEAVAPVTASTLRELPVDSVALAVLAKIRQRQAEFDVTGLLSAAEQPSGRHPLTDDELAAVAAIYRQGGTRPVRHVAETLGITRDAAAGRVRRARAAGHLPELRKAK